MDASGNVYVTDTGNNRIHNSRDGCFTPSGDDGRGTNSTRRIGWLWPDGTITDLRINNRIRSSPHGTFVAVRRLGHGDGPVNEPAASPSRATPFTCRLSNIASKIRSHGTFLTTLDVGNSYCQFNLRVSGGER